MHNAVCVCACACVCVCILLFKGVDISFSLVDEIAAAENGISNAMAVITETDDCEHYNVTIDRLALMADDSVHVDGYVQLQPKL